ncbi:MAG: HD domain-containing protein [Oscillospiraceae bacterium]|nr:HD domain-containing protein [Oscillospiraceae bacterium]
MIKRISDYIKEYWRVFWANIYDGKRSAQNLRSIKAVLILLTAFSFVMTLMNVFVGNIPMTVSTAVLSVIFFLTFLSCHKTGKRAFPILICMAVVMVILTYYIFSGNSNGFAILWTLVVPVFLMATLGVKAGTIMGLYFQIILIVTFWTPLRSHLEMHYTATFMQRYPILYFCTLIITMAVMLSSKRHQMIIDEYQDNLENVLAEERAKVGQITFQTIATITRIVDAKDHYTDDHSARVANYSAHIARELGWAEHDIDKLYNAALLHDIGKIGIQDSILKKIGRLEDSEYEVMKTHTSIGAEILSGLSFIDGAVEGALYHHEKYDGSGYPFGLRGETIPLHARIICIADAFDAMNSDRAYRKRCNEEYIISELKRCRGTHFDPHLVDVLFACLEKRDITIG